MLLLGDCYDVLKSINNQSVDLTVTSPPYDTMRFYNDKFDFNFEGIAEQLFRVTKNGGIVVWVVGDQVIDGDETGTSFRQALHFKEIGFKLHDTMIFSKNTFATPSTNRYHQAFEYMFVFCKRYVKTFHAIIDKINRTRAQKRINKHRFRRSSNDFMLKYHKGYTFNDLGQRFNIWTYAIGGHIEGNTHSASFPLELARDHIVSWSNENDLVLDPFLGSGTTGIAAYDLNRRFIGIDINKEFIEMSKKRLLLHIGESRLAQWCQVKSSKL